MVRFQTTFKKTLYTFVAIGLLIGLGTWQMQRRAWETNLIASMEERGRMPALNQIPAGADYSQIEFRRVALTGFVDDSKILFLGPRTRDGRVGSYMFVPMMLPDRRVLLVNQGFVEGQYQNLIRPGQGSIRAISGTLRQPSQPGLFTPHNPAQGRDYYWLDLAAISTRLGTPKLLPVTLELDSAAASQYSMGAQTHEGITNDHLQYALTWYALALIAAIYYLITSFRSPAVIEQGFRMRNLNLEQGLPPGVRNGSRSSPKPFTSKDDDGDAPSLW